MRVKQRETGEFYMIPLGDGLYRVGRRGGRSALTGKFLPEEKK